VRGGSRKHFAAFRRSGFHLAGRILLDGGDKTIAAAWERFDVAGIVRGIAERFTEAHDGGIQAVVEINESVTGPEALLQFLASDHFAAMFEKDGENLAGLFLKFYPNAMFAQFAGAEVEFVRAKAQRVRRYRGILHGAVRVTIASITRLPRKANSEFVTRTSKSFVLNRPACDE
jgi:hypothetical protein